MADYPPAGAFAVGDYPVPSSALAASAVGVFLADAIDPSTGDYRSISRGVDPVEAAALEALMVRRGTGSAVRDDGFSVADLRVIDDAFESTLRAEIAYAWRRLIDARQLEIVSLAIRSEGDTALVDIRIRNLTQQGAAQGKTLTLPLLTLQGTT
jgi:hypothetical protein